MVEAQNAEVQSSSLQLLSHDQAANAPEIDTLGKAQQSNGSGMGLQVIQP